MDFVAATGLILGIIASLLTIVLSFSKPFRDKVIQRLPHLRFMSYRPRWSMDEVNRAISKAESGVSILQTWIPTLNSDVGHWSEINPHVSFRVLLAREPMIASRLKYRRHSVQLVNQNIASLRDFNANCDLQIGLKLYDGLPFGPLYIVDDLIYWGIFLANSDSMMGPRFTTSRHSRVGKQIEASFESIWNREHQVDLIHWRQVPSFVREIQRHDSVDDESLDGGITPTAFLAKAAKASDPYQRHCSQCGTYLAYRMVGTNSTSNMQSYCPNQLCARFQAAVQDVHVS